MTPSLGPVEPTERLPAWQWVLRVLCVALMLIAVSWFGRKGVAFVYQGF